MGHFTFMPSSSSDALVVLIVTSSRSSWHPSVPDLSFQTAVRRPRTGYARTTGWGCPLPLKPAATHSVTSSLGVHSPHSCSPEIVLHRKRHDLLPPTLAYAMKAGTRTAGSDLCRAPRETDVTEPGAGQRLARQTARGAAQSSPARPSPRPLGEARAPPVLRRRFQGGVLGDFRVIDIF